jgi:hypothetical protein
MIGFSDILPVYPGFALGCIISQSDLYLPIYEKKRASLEEALERATQDKDKEKEREKFKASDNEMKQKVMANHAAKILKLRNDLDQVCNKINELIKTASLFPIEEPLPLDYKCVQLRNENRSFKYERMNHVLFTSNDHVSSKVKTFVSQLFLQDAPSLLPGTLEAMVSNIETVLQTTDARVALIGSFICLERVKVIDPLIIRPNTKLSAELINKSSQYYVLSEAVLGAVFLGIGKDVSIKGEAHDIATDQERISKLTTVSFISQGVIPKLNPKIQDINLWNVYVDWKEALVSDPHSGYPIGFKVRRLQNVLEENHILS